MRNDRVHLEDVDDDDQAVVEVGVGADLLPFVDDHEDVVLVVEV